MSGRGGGRDRRRPGHRRARWPRRSARLGDQVVVAVAHRGPSWRGWPRPLGRRAARPTPVATDVTRRGRRGRPDGGRRRARRGASTSSCARPASPGWRRSSSSAVADWEETVGLDAHRHLPDLSGGRAPHGGRRPAGGAVVHRRALRLPRVVGLLGGQVRGARLRRGDPGRAPAPQDPGHRGDPRRGRHAAVGRRPRRVEPASRCCSPPTSPGPSSAWSRTPTTSRPTRSRWATSPAPSDGGARPVRHGSTSVTSCPSAVSWRGCPPGGPRRGSRRAGRRRRGEGAPPTAAAGASPR